MPGRMRDISKKAFTRKLISVLFELLKDRHDDLDATMITQEIKLRNPKPKLLSQLALNRFAFLAFHFITHKLFFLFCSLCFLLIIRKYLFSLELIWHPTTSVFG